MRKLVFVTLLSLNFGKVYPNNQGFENQDIEKLSYYMGYLIGKEHTKNTYGFPTDFEKLAEGIKAGMSNDPIAEKEELKPLIKRLQKTIVEQQSALNLKEAEAYLKQISNTPEVIELVTAKLTYTVKKQGNGPIISGQPFFHFTMSELKNGELHLIYSTYEDKKTPLQVDLSTVVKGFEKGVNGMKVGEARTIYVHPDLAFGMGKLDIAPNRLIVFDVEAIANE